MIEYTPAILCGVIAGTVTSAHASDRYPAISDEAPRENYSYCDGVNCGGFRSDCNSVYIEKDFLPLRFLR